MHHYSSISLIILLTLLIQCFQGEIELVLTQGTQQQYYTRLCIGEPIQCLNIYIDFRNSFIWLNEALSTMKKDERFDMSRSKTNSVISDLKIEEKGLSIEGMKVKDNIVFPHYTLKQIEMAIALKGEMADFITSGGLGLGFPLIQNNTSSFIQELKNQGLINDRIFTFERVNRDNGRISIGKVPEILIKDYTHLGRCDLKRKDTGIVFTNDWSCLFTSIRIGDTDQVYEDYNAINIYFNIQETFITVPISFLLYLERTYFKVYIEQGVCSITTISLNKYTFICIDSLPDLPSISFKTNDWEFTLESKDLFHIYGNYFFFNMRAYTGQNEWIIGDVALSQFIVLFDQENNKFGLYNEKLVHYTSVQRNEDIPRPEYPTSLPDMRGLGNYSKLKMVGVILVSICMIVGILLLLRSRKRSKMIESYQKKNTFFNLLD